MAPLAARPNYLIVRQASRWHDYDYDYAAADDELRNMKPNKGPRSSSAKTRRLA